MNKFRSHSEATEDTVKSAAAGQADEMLKKASDLPFFIEKERLSRLLPPLFMSVGIIIVYIALSHFHVKSLKEKEELKNELNELRSEYISVKSNLMKQSKQSEVANRLTPEGIQELRTPPMIIERSREK